MMETLAWYLAASAFFVVAMWALGAWLGEKIAVPPVIPRTRGGGAP